MAFSLAAIITAYDALGTLNTATQSAYTTLTGLGARPAYPINVTTNTDYTTPTTAQATWDASYATDSAAYNTAVAAQKVGEAAVVSLLSLNVWYKMTGLANWGSAAIQWISIKTFHRTNADNASGANLYTILTSATQPTQNAPLI